LSREETYDCLGFAWQLGNGWCIVILVQVGEQFIFWICFLIRWHQEHVILSLVCARFCGNKHFFRNDLWTCKVYIFIDFESLICVVKGLVSYVSFHVNYSCLNNGTPWFYFPWMVIRRSCTTNATYTQVDCKATTIAKMSRGLNNHECTKGIVIRPIAKAITPSCKSNLILTH
jgi:hypothetical protein